MGEPPSGGEPCRSVDITERSLISGGGDHARARFLSAATPTCYNESV